MKKSRIRFLFLGVAIAIASWYLIAPAAIWLSEEAPEIVRKIVAEIRP